MHVIIRIQTILDLDDDLESLTEDLPPPCYNTPVITDIKATVERATLGSGSNYGGCGERTMLGSGGDGGGRTGCNCGGCG